MYVLGIWWACDVTYSERSADEDGGLRRKNASPKGLFYVANTHCNLFAAEWISKVGMYTVMWIDNNQHQYHCTKQQPHSTYLEYYISQELLSSSSQAPNRLKTREAAIQPTAWCS
uniref:Secreted protein n=1 Tax=Ascaris lumbricoides TaxID=6252 RepID=A0A0M3I7R3_ASCLU